MSMCPLLVVWHAQVIFSVGAEKAGSRHVQDGTPAHSMMGPNSAALDIILSGHQKEYRC